MRKCDVVLAFACMFLLVFAMLVSADPPASATDAAPSDAAPAADDSPGDAGSGVGAVSGSVSAPLASTSGSSLSARDLGLNIEHPYFTVPYSINPSFSVDIPYDFSVYDTIPDLLRRLERCADDIGCIVNNVSIIEGENTAFNWVVSYGGNIISKDAEDEFEYAIWEAYCETPDVHAVNSLAEAIDTCTRSQSNDCVCNYTLPIVTPDEVSRLYGYGLSVGLSSIPAIGPILGIGSFIATMLSDETEWEERVFSLQRVQQGTRVSMSTPPGTNAQIVPNARFRSVSTELRDEGPGSLKYEPGDDGDLIDIYRDDRGNITIHPHGDAPSDELCELHNKIVKFCVIQNQTFLAYNQQDNRMGMQQLVLKFAYLFSSEVTDVRNFEVRDAKFASNKSLLVWDAVQGVDADHYTIYYSENPAMSANLRTASPSEIPDDVRDDLHVLELFVNSKQDISIETASLDSPSCTVFDRTCIPGYELHTVMEEEVSDAMLEDNALFYSTVEERFFYFLPDILNDHSYFFAITVTDVNDQESPSFNMPLDAMKEESRDDLPPGIADVRNVQLNPGTNDVEFTIGPIDYNVDGSALSADAVTNYKIYCAPMEASGEFNLSDHEPVFAQSISSNSDGSVSFSRPASDFTDYNCGLTGSPRSAMFVVSGVKRIGANDYSFSGAVDSQAFSMAVTLPES